MTWNIRLTKANINGLVPCKPKEIMSPTMNCTLLAHTLEKHNRQMPTFTSMPTFTHRHEPPAEKELFWISKRNFIIKETLGVDHSSAQCNHLSNGNNNNPGQTTLKVYCEEQMRR